MTETKRRLSVDMFERAGEAILQHYHDMSSRLEHLKACLIDETTSKDEMAAAFLAAVNQSENLYHETESHLNALKRGFLTEAMFGSLSDEDLVHDMPDKHGAE